MFICASFKCCRLFEIAVCCSVRLTQWPSLYKTCGFWSCKRSAELIPPSTAAHSAARLRNGAPAISEITQACTHTLHKPSGCGPRGATKLVFDALWSGYWSSGGRGRGRGGLSSPKNKQEGYICLRRVYDASAIIKIPHRLND